METLANRPQNSPNLPPNPSPERTPRVPKPELPSPEFKVGDFVWAKIKTHLWWPARVVAVPKAGSYLVSLFLAGSGSHRRESSQLKPFGGEFEPMSKQTSTKSFAVALRVAADELAKESFSDFAPEEFLRKVKEAACDVSACDLLVVARLKSWVLSFVRENGLVVRSLSDLVDVEPIPKGPEIRDGLPSPRRKRKSMAEIISATPDVVSSGKPREKGVDLPAVEVGGGVAEEGIGSPRRERKKSKYLSPPYTFGSGYKRSDSFKEDEEEEEEEVDNEAAGQKEEGKVSALRKYAGISSYVILSQILLAAADPLFQISNRPSKAIWSFLTEFRSSVCSRHAEFEDYVKGLDWSGGFENKTGRSKVVGEAKFSVDNDAVKVGGNAEAGLSVGSEPRKRGRPKKDRSLGEVSMNLGLHIESRKKEDAANGVSMAIGKSRPANGGPPHDACHDTTGLTELAKLGQKRKSKSGEEGGNGGIQSPNSTGGHSNESEGRAPRQTRRKKEVSVVAPLVEEQKHPFAYVRENLEMMISTLTGTSSGIVLAGGLKPELKENLVSEIQGMLNRVNSLQTEIARYS